MLQHTRIGKFLSKLLVAAFFLGAIQFVNADAGYAWKTPAPITLKGDSLTTTYGTSDSMTVIAQGGYPGYTFEYSTPIDGVTFEQLDSATVTIKVSETATPGVYQEVISATDVTTVKSDPQTFNITILKADRTLNLAAQKPVIKFGEKVNIAAYVNTDVSDKAKSPLGADGTIQFTTDSSTACSVDPGTGSLTAKNNSGTCFITAAVTGGTYFNDVFASTAVEVTKDGQPAKTQIVYFNENNGSPKFTAISGTASNSITFPKAPVRPGYNFSGWSEVSVTSQAPVFQPGTSISFPGNKIFYALWNKPDNKTIKKTFGTALTAKAPTASTTTSTAPVGSFIPKPAAKLSAPVTNTKQASVVAANDSSTALATLTVEGTAITGNSQTVHVPNGTTAVSVIAIPSNDSQTVKIAFADLTGPSWTRSIDVTYYSMDPNPIPIDVTAADGTTSRRIWVTIVVDPAPSSYTYSIQYDLGSIGVDVVSPNPVDSQTGSVSPGSVITFDATSVTRSNHQFDGWWTTPTSGGVRKNAGDTITINSNYSVTLYARWTQVAWEYGITFNNNGGIGSMTSQSGTAGNITLNNNSFTNSGYTFMGWNTNALGTGDSYSNHQVINLNANFFTPLYAQWRYISLHQPVSVSASYVPVSSGAQRILFSVGIDQADSATANYFNILITATNNCANPIISYLHVPLSSFDTSGASPTIYYENGFGSSQLYVCVAIAPNATDTETAYTVSNLVTIPNTYIEFDLNGAPGSTPAQLVGLTGENQALPAPPSWVGHTFLGWQETTTGIPAWLHFGKTLFNVGDQFVLYNINETLTAQWQYNGYDSPTNVVVTRFAEPVSYGVTTGFNFDASWDTATGVPYYRYCISKSNSCNDSYDSGGQSYDRTTLATNLGTPFRGTFSFIGVPNIPVYLCVTALIDPNDTNTNTTCSNAVPFIKRTVTYVVNGTVIGTFPTQGDLYPGDTFTVAAGPHVFGKTFTKWISTPNSRDSSGTIVSGTSGYWMNPGDVYRMSDTNTVLSSTYTVLSVSYSFDSSSATGGTRPSTINSSFGSTITFPSNTLTKDGYSFGGWSWTNASGAHLSQAGDTYTINDESTTVTISPTWNIDYFTVRYLPGAATSGTPPALDSYTSGTTVTNPSNTGNLARSGWGFAGWSPDTHTTLTLYGVGGSFTINEDKVFYPSWKSVLSYDLNNGSGSNPGSQDFYEGNNAIALDSGAGITRSGFNFGGWSTTKDDSSTVVSTFTGGAEAVTVYAIWTPTTYSYQITFNAGTSGSGSMSVQSGTGATVQVSENTFTRLGYTFNGWSGSNGQNYVDSETISLSDTLTVTLTAKWTFNVISAPTGVVTTYLGTFAGKRRIKVEWNAVSGANYYNVVLSRGGCGAMVVFGPMAASGLSNPPSYTFDWEFSAPSVNACVYAGPNSTDTFTAAGVSSSITIPQFTFTYELNGGTSSQPDSRTGYTADTFTIASTPTKANSTFLGWFNGTDTFTSGSTYTIGTTSETFTARWLVDTFTVIYSAGDHGSITGTTSQTVNAGEATSSVTATPATGYHFVSWSDGNLDASRSDSNVLSSQTFTASFAIDTHTVRYVDSIGTETLPGIVTLNYGDTFTTEAAPTRLGYTFNGWNDGTNTFNGGSTYTVGNSNVVLTAQWTHITYSITYNSNTGNDGTTPTDSTNYYYGDTSTVQSNSGMGKNGYTFVRWTTISDGTGITYNPGDSVTITGSITLYANWTGITYTIRYDSNTADGGTVPNPGQYLWDGPRLDLETQTTLTKTGYHFIGWSDTAANTNGLMTEWYNDGVHAQGSAYVYAIWAIDTFTVVFDPNGGTGTTTYAANYGSDVFTNNPSAPTKANYYFAGWSLANSNDTNTAITSLTITSNKTIYAIWIDAITKSGGSETITTSTGRAASGLAYSVSGGVGPYTFSIRGETATGLISIDPSTGAVLVDSSTPASTFHPTIEITDSQSHKLSYTINVIVHPAVTLSVSSPPLVATAGTAKTFTNLQASNGSGIFTWTISPSLSGISIDTSGQILVTNTISSGTYNESVTASDSFGSFATVNVQIVVNDSMTVSNIGTIITTKGRADANSSVAVTGGTGTKVFAFTNNPLGSKATLNTATGSISIDNSVDSGTYTVSISVTDENGSVANYDVAITVNAAIGITGGSNIITTAGHIMVSDRFLATGGTGPLTYAISNNGSGATINWAGYVSIDTNATAGSWYETITVTDSLSVTETTTIHILVNPMVAVTTVTGIQHTQGVSETFTAVSVTGGTNPITYSISGPNSGFSIDSSTGVVTLASSVTAGTRYESITATDSLGMADTKTITFVINAPMSITQLATFNMTQGKATYTDTLTVSGGTTPFVFSISDPSTDISFNTSTGRISLSENLIAGDYYETVTVTDKSLATAQTVIRIHVNSPITVAGGSVVTTTTGVLRKSTAFTASNGTGTKTFSLIAPPSGISIDTSTGVLTVDSATAANTYSITVRATDSVGATTDSITSVVVNPAIVLSGGSNITTTSGIQDSGTVLSYTGGTGTITYSMSYYPTGLGITTSTGLITVYANAPAATFWETVTATDSVGATAKKAFLITISAGMNFTAGGDSVTSSVETFGSGAPVSGMTFTYNGSAVAIDNFSNAASKYKTYYSNYSQTANAIGYTLFLDAPTASTVITFPANDQPTSFSYLTEYVNGNSTGFLTYSDASTSSLNVVDISTNCGGYSCGPVTLTGNGKRIASLTIDATTDIFMIDNITWGQPIPAISTTVTIPATASGFSVTGGTGTKVFTISPDTRTGITVNSVTGAITAASNTPAGTYLETLTVTDSKGSKATRVVTIVVNPAITISGGSKVTTTYGVKKQSTAFTTANGTGAKVLSLVSPPTGITLDSSTGIISVESTTAVDTYTITIRSTDSVGAIAETSTTVLVNAAITLAQLAPVITTNSRAAQSTVSTATGGTPPITYSFGGVVTCTIGSSSSCPGSSAYAIKVATGTNTNGLYWINVNGTPTQIYALMDSNLDGGGWQLAMKGKSGGTSFPYSANYWTTNNTLIPSGETTPGPLSSSNNDAKYSTFNSSNASQFMVLYPSLKSNTYTGGAFPSQTTTYGFAWKDNTYDATPFNGTGAPTSYRQPFPSANGATINRQTYNGTPASSGCLNSAAPLLTLFQTENRCLIRQVDSTYQAGETPYSVLGNVFSGQSYVNFYGFNYVGGNSYKARLGVSFNQDSFFDEGSNDSVGGIGLSTYSGDQQAGNYNNCCTTQTGIGASAAASFEMYIRDTTNGVPIGVTLNSTTGQVSVAANTAPGTYTQMITATDAAGATAQETITITVNESITVSGGSAIATTVGRGQATTAFTATGGTGTLTLSETSTAGAHVSFDPATGIAYLDSTTAAGSYTITVTATDTLGVKNIKTTAVTVNANVTLTGPAVDTTTYGVTSVVGTYTGALGTGTRTFSMSPTIAGIAINSSNGQVTVTSGLGDTQTAQSYYETITLTDSVGDTKTLAIKIVVNIPITMGGGSSKIITTFSRPIISETFTATGGTAPLTYSLVPSQTSNGITVNSSGVVSVTGTTPANTYNESVTVTDAAGATARLPIQIVVNPPITFSGQAGGAGTGLNVYLMNYNSGLTSQYNAQNHPIFTTGTCASLTGQNLNFNFDAAGVLPSPCVGDYFAMYATGYFVAPASGTISFRLYSDDSGSFRITANGTTYESLLTGCCTYSTYVAVPNMVAGQYYKVDSFLEEMGGAAYIYVYYALGDNSSPSTIIPLSMFSSGAAPYIVNTTTTFRKSSVPIIQNGGTDTVTVVMSPDTQTGITYDTSTGRITVDETVAPGLYYETLTGTDTFGVTGSQMFKILVNPRLGIAGTQNINTTYGVESTTVYSGTDGTSPDSYTVSGLNSHFTIDSATGILTVDSTTPIGTYYETVTAYDFVGDSSSVVVQILINPTVLISGGNSSLTTTRGLAAYSAPFTGSRGTGAIRFSRVSNPVSTYIAIDSVTGIMTVDSLTAVGVYTETVTATDSVNGRTNYVVKVTVNREISVAGPDTMTTTQGRAYNSAVFSSVTDTATQTNGTGAKVLSMSPDTFTGITFNPATGIITVDSSTPAGTYIETITATDTLGVKGYRVISILVNPLVTITGGSDIYSTLGYGQRTANFVANFGTYGKTWKVDTSTTGVTTGLAFGNHLTIFTVDSSTAYFYIDSTTPVDTYTLTVTATDGRGDTETATFLIRIAAKVVISGGSGVITTYGREDTSTAFIATLGTFTKVWSISPTVAGITIDQSGYVHVAATTVPGTYIETITATDSVTAHTETSTTIVVNKAIVVTGNNSSYGSIAYGPGKKTIITSPSGLGLGKISWWQYISSDSATFGPQPSNLIFMNAGGLYTYMVNPNVMGISINGGWQTTNWRSCEFAIPNGSVDKWVNIEISSDFAMNYVYLSINGISNACDTSPGFNGQGALYYGLPIRTSITLGENFPGYIADFRISTAEGHLSSNFVPQTEPSVLDTSTDKLLLSAKNQASVATNSASSFTVTSNTGTYISRSPYGTQAIATTVGIPLSSSSFGATGGTGALVYSLSDTITGISIDSSTGVISVTGSMSAATYYETVTVTDTLGVKGYKPVFIIVNPTIQVQDNNTKVSGYSLITTQGRARSTAAYTYTGGTTNRNSGNSFGGTGPIVYSLTDTYTGITIDSATGIIYVDSVTAATDSLTPRIYYETVTATDNVGAIGQVALTILINPPVQITGGSNIITTYKRADSSTAFAVLPNAIGGYTGTGPYVYSIASASSGGSGVSNGLVDYWSFDNAATFAQPTTGSATITANGNAAYSASGKFGGALALDGTGDYLSGTVSSLPIGNSNYTISAWIKTNGNAGGYGIAGWGSFGGSWGTNALRTCGTTCLVNYWWDHDIASASMPNPNGTWVQVAATWDGTTRSIWANGTLLASDTPGMNHTVANTNFRIGLTATGEYFNGLIDDLAIYNRALSSTELLKLAGGSAGSAEITIDSTTGVVSVSNNTSAGTYLETVTVTDAKGSTNSTTMTVTVNSAVVVTGATNRVTTYSIPDTMTGAHADSGTVNALTFSRAYIYSLSGNNPGFSIDTATGVVYIAGTVGSPTATTYITETITAVDALGSSGYQTFVVRVNPSIIITGPQTMVTTTGKARSYQETTTSTTGTTVYTGGLGTIDFTLTGNYPTYFSIGTKSGLFTIDSSTPAGSYIETITATDTMGATSKYALDILVNPAPVIGAGSNPRTTYGRPDTATGFTATFGTATNITGSRGTIAFVYALTGDTTSALVFDTTNGNIKTTATTPAGVYRETVTVTDSMTAKSSVSVVITVYPSITVTNGGNIISTVGIPYSSAAFTANNGTDTKTFGVTDTSFGISVGASSGIVTYDGTLPANGGAAKVYTETITATDSLGMTGYTTFTITVNPAVVVSNGSDITTTNGFQRKSTAFKADSGTVLASGGTRNWIFSLSDTVTGITIDSTTGVVTVDSNTAVMNIYESVTATDDRGKNGYKSIHIIVNTPVTIDGGSDMVTTRGRADTSTAFAGHFGTSTLTYSLTDTYTGITIDQLGYVHVAATTAVNTYYETVTVTDTIGSKAQKAMTIRVNQEIAVAAGSDIYTTTGILDTSTAFTKSFGTAPLTFSLDPVINGITIDTNGVVTAAATLLPDTYTETVTVTDSLGVKGYKSMKIVVAETVTVTAGSNVVTTNGVRQYSTAFVSAKGTGSRTFSISGNWPGISISSGGVVTVESTTAVGIYYETVTATDSKRAIGQKAITIRVNSPVTLTKGLNIVTTEGRADSATGYVADSGTVIATGGSKNYEYKIQTANAVTKPAGITIDSVTGVIYVSSSVAAGTYIESVTATDSMTSSATQLITIVVNGKVAVTGPSRIVTTYNIPQTRSSETVTGGTVNALTFSRNLIWSISGNASITIDSATGVITIPTGIGSSSSLTNIVETITVTDALNQTGTETFTVQVNPAIIVFGTTSMVTTVGKPRTYGTDTTTGGTTSNTTVAVSTSNAGSNGTRAMIFTLSDTYTGISIDSTTGAISIGANTAAGTYAETVTATDSVSATGTLVVSILVNPAPQIGAGQNIITTFQRIDTATGFAATFGTATNIAGSRGTSAFVYDLTGDSTTVFTFDTTTGNIVTKLTTPAGFYRETVTVTDSMTAKSSVTLTILVNPSVSVTGATYQVTTYGVGLTMSSDTATGGTVLATGGSRNWNFSIAGTAPGVTIDTNTGVVTIPNNIGSSSNDIYFYETITATDALNMTGSQTFTIRVNKLMAFVGTTTMVTTTGIYRAYQETTTGGTSARSDGTGNIKFSLDTPTAGITIDTTTGLLKIDTSTAAATYTNIITTVDSMSTVLKTPITIYVNAAPVMTKGSDIWTTYKRAESSTAFVVDTTTGTTSYTHGSGSYTFSIASANGVPKPAGITIDPVTGIVKVDTGTAPGTYYETVTATDSMSAKVNILETITVNDTVTVTGGVTYLETTWTIPVTLTAFQGAGGTILGRGGNAGFVYSVSQVRSGISIDSSSGEITLASNYGDSTTASTYTETVTAQDNLGMSGYVTFRVKVNKPIAISDTPTITANYETATSYTYAFTNGTGPISSVITGAIPAGITWDTSTAGRAVLNIAAHTLPQTIVETITTTDTRTATSFKVVTITIKKGSRTLTISSLTVKYGETGTAVVNYAATNTTGDGGTYISDGTLTFAIADTSTNCTIDTTTGVVSGYGGAGTCNIKATRTAGTYYDSSTSATLAVTISQADTLTVNLGALPTLNYTGSAAVFTPTFSVTGLVNGDTQSAVTYYYRGTNSTCALGGACSVGDIGPGGGIVFYAGASFTSNGQTVRYLEAAPSGWNGTTSDPQVAWSDTTTSISTTATIGTGYTNSVNMVSKSATSGYAGTLARSYSGGGKTDWYLPSYDELAALYTNRAYVPGIVEAFDTSTTPAALFTYWSSTQSTTTTQAKAYGFASSNVTGNGWKDVSKSDSTTAAGRVRPIRAFDSSTVNITYTSSQTKPTNAGVYLETATGLVLANSRPTTNYKAVVYNTTNLTINRIQQAQLKMNANMVTGLGTKFQLYTSGGSGTGAVTFKITAGGTATGCQIGGTTYNYYLTASGVGNCLVTATKAGDINYFETTSVVTPVTIVFIQFFNPFLAQGFGSGNINITPGINIGYDTGTSGKASYPAMSGVTGVAVIITGTNFTGVTSVKLMDEYVTSFTIDSSTQITFIPGILNGTGALFTFKGFAPTRVTGSGTNTFTILNPLISLSSASEAVDSGTAIVGYTITNIASAATSYAISGGTLPAGLTFSASTGLISGTPTASLAATTFTITATNTNGSSTGTYTLTVR